MILISSASTCARHYVIGDREIHRDDSFVYVTYQHPRLHMLVCWFSQEACCFCLLWHLFHSSMTEMICKKPWKSYINCYNVFDTNSLNNFLHFGHEDSFFLRMWPKTWEIFITSDFFEKMAKYIKYSKTLLKCLHEFVTHEPDVPVTSERSKIEVLSLYRNGGNF